MEQREFYDHLGEARSATLNASEQYRVHRTLAILPTNVETVIDVASGDGRLARHLLDAKRVVQCDISMPSLLAASGDRVQSDVAHLPFADQRFDDRIPADLESSRNFCLFADDRQSRKDVLRISFIGFTGFATADMGAFSEIGSFIRDDLEETGVFVDTRIVHDHRIVDFGARLDDRTG